MLLIGIMIGVFGVLTLQVLLIVVLGKRDLGECPQPRGVKITMSFVVKDNNPDVPFTLVLGDVTDAEGNVIPDAALDITVASDNDAAVAVTFDAATKAGSVSFGSPGQANVTANVSSGGVLLGTGAASFVVTLGDPAAITSVALNFAGLIENV